MNLAQNPSGDWVGPKRRQVGRLFDYLGIQDPGDKRAFRMAARGGQLGTYFQDLPKSYEMFNKLITSPGTEYTGRKAKRFGRLQDAAQQIGYVGRIDKYNPNAPSTTPNAGNKPPVSNSPGSPPPGAGIPPAVPATIEDMLKRMGGYLGPTGQGIGNQITNMLSTGTNLTPGYQNMFKNLLASHQDQAARGIAGLNEAFGARGARYGSDILNAQGDMRRQQTNDLNLAGDQLALQLMQNQQGLLGLGQQSAGMEQQARENAMSRMFQEYLMQSQLPPIFQSMIGALSGLPQGDTLSYIS